jgi:hypothetical protein
MEIPLTTWEMLQNLDTSEPVNITLNRLPEIQQKYEIHKKEINMDINDYLKNLFFNDSYDTYLLNGNRFPYNCEPNIKHMLLWINPKHNPPNQEINNYIEEIFKSKNIIYFENIEKNKSVIGIRHFHIFIKQ